MSTIPGIPYGPAPRAQSQAGALTTPPPFVVVHATDNPTSNARGEASYAATRTDSSGNWTSCHAYVDASGALGSLPLHLRAWSAYSWANAHGWHVELCGVSGRVPLDVQRNGAALVRHLCQLGGIPMVHRAGPAVRAYHDGAPGAVGGVTGHGDITAANFDNNDHTDPGFSAADWQRFMGWVTSDTQGSGGMAGEKADGILSNTIQYDNALYSLIKRLMDGTDPYYNKLTGQPVGSTTALYSVEPGLRRGNLTAIATQLDQLIAAATAEVARDAAFRAAFDALAAAITEGGGNVDTAAILGAINDAVDAVHDDVKARFAAASAVA